MGKTRAGDLTVVADLAVDAAPAGVGLFQVQEKRCQSLLERGEVERR